MKIDPRTVNLDALRDKIALLKHAEECGMAVIETDEDGDVWSVRDDELVAFAAFVVQWCEDECELVHVSENLNGHQRWGAFKCMESLRELRSRWRGVSVP